MKVHLWEDAKIWCKKEFSLKRLNKFKVATIIFVVWITFFDNHNLIDTFKVSRNVSRMKVEMEEYKNMIADAKKQRISLDEDKEKFARENYYMHKTDEEVFIIEKNKQ